MRGAFCPHCGHPARSGARFCAGCGSLLAAGSAVLPVGTRLQAGRYTIARLMGRGGNGAVYQAEDTRLRRACVVKELQPDYLSTAEQRRAEADFHREALILARLSTEHPGLPQTYDFFNEQGRHYLVMQYVAGLDLESRLRTGGPLAEAEAVGHGAAIAEVLAFLHAQQPEPVIHRDVKPANIIVDAQGRVKLVDFGLAKALLSTTSALRAGAVGQTSAAGTAGYTPVEQWALAAEVRSDVYALGATLHHLLTGRDPRTVFEGQGELNLELIRRLTVFPPLRALRGDVTPALDSLLTAMLAPEPAARPPAAEVSATLSGLLKPGRSRVTSRPARRPAAAPPDPAVLSVPLLDRARLAAAVAGWLRTHVEGFPAREPVLLESARADLVPLALGAYHVSARYEAPDGRIIHSLDEQGVAVLDGATARSLDPPLANFLAGMRGALATVSSPAPDVQVGAFRLDARQLREMLISTLILQYTRPVSYRGNNGRTYTRECKPARKGITFDGGAPILFHHPCWSLRFTVRGHSYDMQAYQAAPDTAGPPLWVVGGDMAGRAFCPGCGRLLPVSQMTACAACGKRICARCVIQKARLGIFRKPFCSPACVEAFSASGSVIGWM